jgi:hypothetical protein
MNREFKKRFPKLAERFENCRKFHGIPRDECYGYFFNFCLNMARPHIGLKRVHCKPHVDWKNLAIGICVIFIYGKPLQMISLVTTLTQLPRQFQ